tara:strand:+ start:12499 stop:13185 length:687 start_codon:yes stop_codon:yes gene_type:complete
VTLSRLKIVATGVKIAQRNFFSVVKMKTLAIAGACQDTTKRGMKSTVREIPAADPVRLKATAVTQGKACTQLRLQWILRARLNTAANALALAAKKTVGLNVMERPHTSINLEAQATTLTKTAQAKQNLFVERPILKGGLVALILTTVAHSPQCRGIHPSTRPRKSQYQIVTPLMTVAVRNQIVMAKRESQTTLNVGNRPETFLGATPEIWKIAQRAVRCMGTCTSAWN